MLYPLSYAGPYTRGRIRTCVHPLLRRSSSRLRHRPKIFKQLAGKSAKRVRGLSLRVPCASGLRPRPRNHSASAGFSDPLCASLEEVTLFIRHRRFFSGQGIRDRGAGESNPVLERDLPEVAVIFATGLISAEGSIGIGSINSRSSRHFRHSAKFVNGCAGVSPEG